MSIARVAKCGRKSEEEDIGSLFLFILLKEIQKALSAKEPDLSSCKELGDDLKKYLVQEEKPKVDQAQSEVDEKWRSLQADVDELAKKLFSSQARVDSYQLEVNELKAWLTDTEGKLTNLEPVGVEPEQVKQQLGTQAVSCVAVRKRLCRSDPPIPPRAYLE